MTVYGGLKVGAFYLLRSHCTESPWLDALLLLAADTGFSKERLLASYERNISCDAWRRYKKNLRKRAQGAPVAYLLREKEFFGLPFFVEDGVLCPRPETELLVEVALSLVEQRRLACPSLLDLCTGSGCVAITMKKQLPHMTVDAVDLSPRVVHCFQENNQRHTGGGVKFFGGSLFDEIDSSYDLITANPPYLTSAEVAEKRSSGWKEPEIALDGGVDGLDTIAPLIREAPSYLKKRGALLIEIAPSYVRDVCALFMASGLTRISVRRDLSGFDRVVVGERKNDE